MSIPADDRVARFIRFDIDPNHIDLIDSAIFIIHNLDLVSECILNSIDKMIEQHWRSNVVSV